MNPDAPEISDDAKILRVFVHREDERPRGETRFPDFAQSRDAATAGHGDVEQQEVRSSGRDLLDRRGDVLCFADDLHVGLALDGTAERLANQRVIVGQ